MQRIIFVNLHGNGFLIKTLNLILFKQSGAIKHKYLLDYLLTREDIEVCSFINKKGFSLSYSHAGLFPQWIDKLEHKFTLWLNGIPQNKVKVITEEKEIRSEDIIIMYNYYENHYAFNSRPRCLVAISQIHLNTKNSEKMRCFNPDVLFCESRYKGSLIYNYFYSWFQNRFIVIPFVFGDRFKDITPFSKRKNICFSTGTIVDNDEITQFYGDPCCQPTRRQVFENQELLKGFVDCFNSRYSENDRKSLVSNNNFIRSMQGIYAKLFTGKQKKYFSFNMAAKFNEYKMCLVGEDVMGIPGVGFVEGMACGCAYIGQTIGYYEDYGMKEGVHYIGYDGTLDDLKSKIRYYQQPEHQMELEKIAKTGCAYVRKNFCGPVIAEKFINQLIEESKKRYL